MQLAPQTVDKLQNAARFGFHDRFHHQLATAIQDGDDNRFLVHVHADILHLATHSSCLLEGKVIRIHRIFPSRYIAILQWVFLSLPAHSSPIRPAGHTLIMH
jgi:hypothetical protein